jgi:ferredoxin
VKTFSTHATHAALALLTLSFAAGCGLENSVVGGRCRAGMELSNGTCVAQEPGVTLITPTDPPVDSSANGTVTVPKTPTRDPFQAIPQDPNQPEEPFLPPPPPKELVCDANLVACHGACIPVASDGNNCGACGKICPSNICIDGECQGATTGDVVLIGHDYTNAWSGSAQSKVLVNALTIPTTDPIRVLSYEDGASPGAVSQAKALAAAGIYGRKVQFTVAQSATDLASDTLAKGFDVVLIHEASGGDALTVGASWAESLGKFTVKGGVVVALDRGTSPMPELLSSSGLLSVTSHTLLADGTHLQVTGAADVVGAQVLSPYAGFGASISFQGLDAPSADLGWVVRAKTSNGTLGDPVVVHRTVRFGNPI